MDGNNRWSKSNAKDLKTSYKKGAEKLFKIVDRKSSIKFSDIFLENPSCMYTELIKSFLVKFDLSINLYFFLFFQLNFQ